MANGGLREESSVVTGDGEVIRGETGPEPIIENINGLDVQTAEGSLPDLPDGTNKKDATLIHSHPIGVQIKGDKAFPQTATTPSAEDAGTFVSFGTNIIVGNLSTRSVTKNASGKFIVGGSATGAVIFRGMSPIPKLILKRGAIKRIVK